MNTRKINRKRKNKSRTNHLLEIMVIIFIVLYEVFTCVSFWSLTKARYDVIENRPTDKLKSIWLDSTPFHQRFDGEGVGGIRLWLSNPYNVSEGVVSVKIGREDTGSTLYTEEILVTDITDSVLEDSIDVFPEGITFEDEVPYYIEIDAFSCQDKTIKTYIGLSESYAISHAGDERDFSGYGLCMVRIVKLLPVIFMVWIFVTILVILALVTFFTLKKRRNKTVRMRFPSSRESKFVIPVIVIVALFGSGMISPAKIEDESVDYNDERLADGYVLEENSDFSQDFTVDENELKEIHIVLKKFFVNEALFVVVVKDKNENILKSVQSNELDYLDETYYSLDVSDLELSKEETYTISLFTGYISEDEEKPIIKRIEYIY